MAEGLASPSRMRALRGVPLSSQVRVGMLLRRLVQEETTSRPRATAESPEVARGTQLINPVSASFGRSILNASASPTGQLFMGGDEIEESWRNASICPVDEDLSDILQLDTLDLSHNNDDTAADDDSWSAPPQPKAPPPQQQRQQQRQKEGSGHYGSLVLEKKAAKTKMKSNTTDETIHGAHLHRATAEWLAQHSRNDPHCSIFLYSPRTRDKIVSTLAEHVARRIVEENSLLVLKQGRKGARGRGCLIVTTKANLEAWGALLRSQHHLRLHTYQDTLAKRRATGPNRLRSHDCILTTLDTLKAKELAIPERDSEGDEEEEEGPAAADDPWHTARPRGGKVVEMSFLHLFHFELLIVDASDASNSLRRTSARGEAVASVSADSRICLVPCDEASRDDMYTQAQPSVRNARQLMSVTMPTASLVVDFRR